MVIGIVIDCKFRFMEIKGVFDMSDCGVVDSISCIRSFLSNVVLPGWEEIGGKGMERTPERIAKMWQELTKGYLMRPEEILSVDFDNVGWYDELVLLRNVDFYSTCEHHLLPFFGVVHIGYIVRDRIVGLSKLARLVECFSRRLQTQERMTRQISDSLFGSLDPVGVGVIVEGKHLCMMMRGIEKQNAVMVTSSMEGALREDGPPRSEFIRLCGL